MVKNIQGRVCDKFKRNDEEQVSEIFKVASLGAVKTVVSDSFDQRSNLLLKLSKMRTDLANMEKSRENAELKIQNLRQAVIAIDERVRTALQQGREDSARQLLIRKAAGQKLLTQLEAEFQEQVANHEKVKETLQQQEARAEAIMRTWRDGPITERQARARLDVESQLGTLREEAGVSLGDGTRPPAAPAGGISATDHGQA